MHPPPAISVQAHSETPVLPPHSLAVAAFSTIVEWYDFTLYLYFATVLARVFYGGGRGSLLLTLGGFAIAYLMRPLGALFFSHIGDKRGRRHMMLLSVALMTAAMLATALLPTRTIVGPAAGWLLLGLRCVMGFSVGGEYTGVVAYLLEGAPVRRRGLITSSASAASEVGGLLAVGVSALTVSLMSAPDLDRWGWRIPFFVGAALPITMFSLMAGSTYALLGAVILALLAGAVSAVGAVATAEQFPGEGRITGLALGATMATAIFGGLTPLAAQLLVERTGWSTAPAIMIALVAIAMLPLMLRTRDA